MTFASVGPVTAVRWAVKRWRERHLSAAYQLAWEEWEASGDAALWDVTVGDCLEPEDWSAEPSHPSRTTGP